MNFRKIAQKKPQNYLINRKPFWKKEHKNLLIQHQFTKGPKSRDWTVSKRGTRKYS